MYSRADPAKVDSREEFTGIWVDVFGKDLVKLFLLEIDQIIIMRIVTFCITFASTSSSTKKDETSAPHSDCLQHNLYDDSRILSVCLRRIQV